MERSDNFSINNNSGLNYFDGYCIDPALLSVSNIEPSSSNIEPGSDPDCGAHRGDREA